MSVTIKYQSESGNKTLASYTQEWATTFGDIRNTNAPDFSLKMGEFTGGNQSYKGTEYSIISSHSNDFAMIIKGDVNYSFMDKHTFYGKMESLELGEFLNNNPEGNGKHLNQVKLKLCDLNITGEFDTNKTMTENHQGEMHKATYGLMRGNADPLLEILIAKGIDVNTPLKDMSIASQFDVMMSDAPMIDTVGVGESHDMLLAA